MQAVGGLLESEPAAYIGGRYRTAGDKPLPALKAVKAIKQTPPPVYGPPISYPGAYSSPALPPGLAYPPAVYPVPLGAPVTAPTGDLLPPQQLGRPMPVPSAALPPLPTVEAISPVPSVQAIQAVTVPEPLPSMTAPTAPVPTMPEPIPPVAEAIGLKLKVGSQPYLTVPPLGSNAPPRMSAEDLRRLYDVWIRFWFNDPPRHLTPERIHGGIY
jgi:hypothetical protein